MFRSHSGKNPRSGSFGFTDGGSVFRDFVGDKYPAAGGIFGLAEVSLLVFRDEWANYRGAIWTDGVLVYRSMNPLYKLIGIGPDCFAEYLYTVPELADRVYAQFGDSRLTNAHNEWLTTLINQGVLGLVCYVGILFRPL